MAALVGVGMIAALCAPEPARPPQPARDAKTGLSKTLRETVIAPFSEFLSRPGAWWILVFVLFYKYGDAVAGAMANPFYYRIGFTGLEIAGVTKIFGVAATLAGVVAGGVAVAKLGVWPALLAGGILQALTNLLFAWLAHTGNDLTLLAIAIGADSFTGGLGSTAFVAYLSWLCHVSFTATQFALLTSLMAFGRTLLATTSGVMAEKLGWTGFFVATTALAVPGLLLLFWLRRYPLSIRSTE